MSSAYDLNNFDPNGVGLRNGHFIGLPFSEEESKLVCISVPWDVTVSYQAGTSTGPENILQASSQLDLYLREFPDTWREGIFVRPSDPEWKTINSTLRAKAEQYIDFLESGGKFSEQEDMIDIVRQIHTTHQRLHDWVYDQSCSLLDSGKLVGVIGGEHSVPLGLMRALSERYDTFGVLQIDAHMDLRRAYEGFEFSHASIFYEALKLPQLNCLVQVGIRDMCEEEVTFAKSPAERVHVYWDEEMKRRLFEGETWKKVCEDIIEPLPEKVYISFDIDGLQPEFCPHTGTPVPGGLSFQEAMFLLHLLVKSGRTIIGFDLCEVAGLGHEWDGNVGARVLYRLATCVLASQYNSSLKA